MLGPRNRPTSYHSRPPVSRPPIGSTSQVYSRHQKRQNAEGGTRNSRLATVPPGLTTLASSASVACGRDVTRALPEHLLGQVEPDNPGAGTGRELQRYTGRSRCYVEHYRGLQAGLPARRDAVHHRATPPAVLAEGQQLREPVVAPAKGREQLLSKVIALIERRTLHGVSSVALDHRTPGARLVRNAARRTIARDQAGRKRRADQTSSRATCRTGCAPSSRTARARVSRFRSVSSWPALG